MPNAIITLEDSLELLTKLNIVLAHDPTVRPSLLLLENAENLRLHKNLHTDVYSSFIHNCQNL